jgi:hydroxymethylpyrimidine/phosphomethylpyrimidine kinase
MSSTPPVALTIAGSDSSGGAGLQADLKTFEAFGVFGASAITLVTAQNTRGVSAIEVLDPALVIAQARAVLDDLPVAAIKLGALGRADVIEAVAVLLRERKGLPIVIDPVMVSKHGHPLLDAAAARALAEHVLPVATVLTPNRHEAAALVGFDVAGEADAEAAARALLARGPRAVVVTGGGAPGDTVVDVVATAAGVRRLPVARVPGGNVHGSGCTFAAAITARLALGDELDAAIDAARAYTVAAIARAPGLGGGVGPLGHRP